MSVVTPHIPISRRTRPSSSSIMRGEDDFVYLSSYGDFVTITEYLNFLCHATGMLFSILTAGILARNSLISVDCHPQKIHVSYLQRRSSLRCIKNGQLKNAYQRLGKMISDLPLRIGDNNVHVPVVFDTCRTVSFSYDELLSGFFDSRNHIEATCSFMAIRERNTIHLVLYFRGIFEDNFRVRAFDMREIKKQKSFTTWTDINRGFLGRSGSVRTALKELKRI